jgi:AraC family transcriptional regulator
MNNYQERILKVSIYIQNHLDDELSLEKLASIAHFSEFHFHRIFTANTGESIKSYVRRLRLERATSDLAFTDLPIIQIAERAGYDTQQSFHRAFKEAFHETPKVFREKKLQAISNYAKAKTAQPKSIPVEIKTIQPMPVAFVRHIGPYQDLPTVWLTLIKEIGMAHFLSEKTLKIGIPYDSHETTPEEKLRYDACVTIDDLPNFKPKGALGLQTLHGGKYAVITHHGAIDTIDKTYEYLFGVWLPQSNYEPAD